MSHMKDIPLQNPEQLGAAIRLKRQEKHLSQNALAQLLGVERKWVLRLEAGNPSAEFGLVLKALDALGISGWLHDADQPDVRGRGNRPGSRLDEVFARLQRPSRK